MYRFLSNFWLTPIKFRELIYSSVEAAYQAAKTLDPDARIAISKMTPGQAKRAGRKVYMRSDWEEIKIDIMILLNLQKYENPQLRATLLATGDAKLIEGNTWGDRFWGVYAGKGENHLGIILMEIRDGLRKE